MASEAGLGIAALRDALRYLPQDGILHVMLAEALEKAGDSAAAEAEYRAALNLGNPQARSALARLRARGEPSRWAARAD